MKAFRIRYQRRKDRKAGRMGEVDEDEDELLSEYSPSELSAIIAAEDKAADESDGELSDDVRCVHLSPLHLLNIINALIELKFCLRRE